jgi:ComF family protein
MSPLSALLDLIFPPRPEEAHVAKLTLDQVSMRLDVRTIPHGVALMPYHDETIRALVCEAKYHNNSIAQKHIAACIQKRIEVTPRGTDGSLTIIPIPLSEKRIRERGYNQVAEIMRYVRMPQGVVTESQVLIRTRHTIPQTQLAKEQRRTNVIGAFVVSPHATRAIEKKHILLVDDVTTTGSTLDEARRALIRGGAKKVTVLAFAHS